MEKRMKLFALVVAVFVLAISGIVLFKQLASPGILVGCPEDAKICPDGTALGRLPPSCEFPECPKKPGVPNPASVYCEKLGGTLEIISEEPGELGGGQVGMCSLPDGSLCEEWTLYRGECMGFPGENGTRVLNPERASLCSIDSDCVPNGACHPNSCINSAYLKDSGPVACTAVCLGPLDCGAGRCSCVAGTCEVVSNR